MADESPQVRLPGKLYRKCGRWWWKVRLPGQKVSRDRALRPQGRRRATTDRRLAQEIAFDIWQEAVRAEAEAAVKTEQAARTLRLKRHFRQKEKTLMDAAKAARAKAKTEAAARAEMQATLDSPASARPTEPDSRPTPRACCECCDGEVPQDQLQHIDSGQRLCRRCLEELRGAAQRQPPEGPAAAPARPRTASSSILNFSCEDPLPRRIAHGSHVLHA
jgi:hypothetical protein